MYAEHEAVGVGVGQPFEWPVGSEMGHTQQDDAPAESDDNDADTWDTELDAAADDDIEDLGPEPPPEWDPELDIDPAPQSVATSDPDATLPFSVKVRVPAEDDSAGDAVDEEPEMVPVKNPFALLVEPAPVFQAARRLDRFPLARTRSTLEQRRGKVLNAEMAKFDADIELEEAVF